MELGARYTGIWRTETSGRWKKREWVVIKGLRGSAGRRAAPPKTPLNARLGSDSRDHSRNISVPMESWLNCRITQLWIIPSVVDRSPVHSAAGTSPVPSQRNTLVDNSPFYRKRHRVTFAPVMNSSSPSPSFKTSVFFLFNSTYTGDTLSPYTPVSFQTMLHLMLINNVQQCSAGGAIFSYSFFLFFAESHSANIR